MEEAVNKKSMVVNKADMEEVTKAEDTANKAEENSTILVITNPAETKTTTVAATWHKEVVMEPVEDMVVGKMRICRVRRDMHRSMLGTAGIREYSRVCWGC
jgi:hypothetical protein